MKHHREGGAVPWHGLLKHVAALALAAVALGCGGTSPVAEVAPRELPLPTVGISGQQVTVFPITLIAVTDSLDWDDELRPREDALRTVDSLIARALIERSPEVDWVLPEALRAAHRRAPGLLADPDRLGTAMLRSTSVDRLPDPLSSQMRSLVGVAGSRFALVPASLFFLTSDVAGGRAELTFALVDVRTGAVRWRNIAPGDGDDPWTALNRALKTLNPAIP